MLQPREKLKQRGIHVLSDRELIALVVGNGVKGENYLKVAEKVREHLKKVSDSEKVFSVSGLQKITGIGEVKANKIIAGIELGRRLFSAGANIKTIKSTEDAVREIGYIARKKNEYVVAIFLNGRYEYISKKTISIGSLNRVSLTPRDVLIPALEVNCANIIMAHNHPSGNEIPSGDDILFTSQMKAACDLVGLELLEHIVISEKGCKVVQIT